MNIEPDIFDYLETTSLEPHDDYTSEITYKDQKIIWNRLKEQDKEIERLNKENEKLKKGLNKLLQLNKYMIHFSSKKTINKLIAKQRNLIYELLEGRPRGIMFGSKGVNKE